MTKLHSDWPTLPDARERRHRRECLAILDAQIALATDGDAWQVLAAARTDVGDVHPSQRASAFAIKLVALHVLATVTVTLLAAYAIG